MRTTGLGLLCLLGCLWVLSGCTESTPERRTTMRSPEETGEPRRNPARPEPETANHPSPDLDGWIYYYGSAQGSQNREKQDTFMLVYTDGYAKPAGEFAKEHHVRLKKQVSDDVMGAIIDQMQQYQFFSWPASPDYSAMKSVPLASVGQIGVQTDKHRHLSAWTSDDIKRMTSADTVRQQRFLDLKMVILAFCQESDMEITTQVQSR